MCLRNACVDCRPAQLAVGRALLIEPALNFALAALELGPPHTQASQWSCLDRALLGALQFLSNAATCCPENQDQLWGLLFYREVPLVGVMGTIGHGSVTGEAKATNNRVRTSERVLDLLLGCGRRRGGANEGRRRCLAVAVALLHNCCAAATPAVPPPPPPPTAGPSVAAARTPEAERRLTTLARDKTLVSTLLRLASPGTGGGDGSSDGSDGSSKEDDEAGFWVLLLLGSAVRGGLLLDLWAASGAGAEGAGGTSANGASTSDGGCRGRGLSEATSAAPVRAQAPRHKWQRAGLGAGQRDSVLRAAAGRARH